MPEEKVTKAEHNQYSKERKYDRDFKYAESAKSLKGGIGNPKNWPGGRWERDHSPYENRKKLEGKKQVPATKVAKSPAEKSSGKKKSSKKVIRKQE